MKISAVVRGAEIPHAYAHVYARERLAGSVERLRIGLRTGQATAVRALAAALEAPYKLL